MGVDQDQMISWQSKNITTNVRKTGPTMAIDSPERFEALIAIADTLDSVETYQDCFGRFQAGYEPTEYENL